MPIYTKKGDRGQTGLFDGARVPKDNVRVEAIGAVDELNTQIGLVIAQVKSQKLKVKSSIKKLKVLDGLEEIQRDLFGIGAKMAGYQGAEDKIIEKGDGIVGLDERVKWIEREIDGMWQELPSLSNFVLPGGSLAGAQLHVARSVCRRAERAAVRANSKLIFKYLNRLSDYLFCLARWVNFLSREEETVWKT